MHDVDFDHEHELGLTAVEREAVGRAILEQDTLELLTVGVDIGSSTSHLLFARVYLTRDAQALSSRFVVVDRQVVWRSPIVLTPFLPDGTIDVRELGHFLRHSYASAGVRPADVDSGAVILTGEAIKRRNARVIDELFASESGKFVCATAGHRLECILAAHGSGATRVSRERGAVVLHADIGGGTTKLALIEGGEIRGVAAFAVGGRVVATDRAGRWTAVADSARRVAAELGVDPTPERLADPSVRRTIAERLADLLVDQLVGGPRDALGRALELTEPLRRVPPPKMLTFSGGVAEYLLGGEDRDHGDLARDLASAVAARLPERVELPVLDPGQRIRATVIGASQFTVQVSGKTIHLGPGVSLPVRNVPVVHLGEALPEEIDPAAVTAAFRRGAARQDRAPGEPMALALRWTGPPTYQRLAALGRGIVAFADAGECVGACAGDGRPGGAGERGNGGDGRLGGAGEHAQPLLLVVDGDVGQSLGRLLERELGLRRPLISVDGIELVDLDFVDVGALLDPPGVVPVVIKSLLFS